MVLGGAAGGVRAEEPAFSPGPYLFLDGGLIAEQAGLARVIRPPERLPAPVVTGEEDRNFQPYVSVLRDADGGRFRMWYNMAENEGQSHVALIESADGIDWIRPHRVLKDPAFIQFGASVIEGGPALAEPSRRYALGYYGSHGGKRGLQIAVSPDGLDWSLLVEDVSLEHGHDIDAIYWDAARGHYAAFVSEMLESGEWPGRRRIPHQSVSRDLVHWEKPWPILRPEPEETGETEFYCLNAVLARGDLLVGIAKILRDDLNAEPGMDARAMGDPNRKAAGIGYSVLAWSRDGRTWERDTEPFLDRARAPGVWDRAHAWIDCQLPVGDEVFLYYGGYRRGHKVERFTERQIGLARMKRDRYVSRTAGYADARLRTVARPLGATELTVNARIGGRLAVRVVDAAGQPIAGFDWTDSPPLTGDAVAIPVRWAKPLASLRGREVAFEFALRESDLYAMELR